MSELLCAHCGQSLPSGAGHLLNLDDFEAELQIVCRKCYRKVNPRVSSGWTAIQWAILHPSLATNDELLDALSDKDTDLEDRCAIVDELRHRLRDSITV